MLIVRVPTNSSQLFVIGAANTASEKSDVSLNSPDVTLQREDGSLVEPSAKRVMILVELEAKAQRPTKSVMEHTLVCACAGRLTATTIGVVHIPLRNNRRVLSVIFFICLMALLRGDPPERNSNNPNQLALL